MKVEIHDVRASEFDYGEVLSRSPVRYVDGAGKSLKDCMTISAHIFVATVDGKIACVWGLVPPSLMSNQAYLWLLHTDLVSEHQFVFVRQSQRVMEEMLKKYERIVGVCMVGEDKSIRWLKWLGAKFGRPQGNRIPFEIKAKNG